MIRGFKNIRSNKGRGKGMRFNDYINTCTGVCPLINAYAQLNYTNSNLSQCLFLVQDLPPDGPVQVYSEYPNFTIVTKGKGCTFLDRIAFQTAIYNQNFIEADQLIPLQYMGYMLAYGLLRYILWHQIKGVFDLSILLGKNTQKFMEALAGSRYACFIQAFENSTLTGWDRAFLYDFEDCPCEPDDGTKVKSKGIVVA